MGLKWVLAALLAGSSLGPLRPAGATDAQFARALKVSGCFPARVSVVQDDEPIKLYNVVCVGSPPRTVIVFCADDACFISPGNDEEN